MVRTWDLAVDLLVRAAAAEAAFTGGVARGVHVLRALGELLIHLPVVEGQQLLCLAHLSHTEQQAYQA